MLDFLGAAGGQWPLLADTSLIAGLYMIGLIVGGGLLVVSAVFGGDADADVDFDLDVDADADLDLDGAESHAPDGAPALSNWFSMRFLIYFGAAFGLIGTVLTWMSDAPTLWVLASAVVGGGVVGQIAHQTFRYIVRSSSDSSTSVRDYVDKTARVTIAIRSPALGEVAVQVGDRERFVPARSRRDDDAFEIGATVGVVAFRSRAVEVVSQQEFEFSKNTQEGGTT